MAHVTFIHGVSNKPAADELLKSWKENLKSASNPIDLGAEGVTSSMIYWADVLYDNPIPLSDYESVEYEAFEALAHIDPFKLETTLNGADGEAKWIAAFDQRLGIDLETAKDLLNSFDPVTGTMAENLERIPLPWFLKGRLLKAFAKDVHHYLFNQSFSPRPGETFEVQTEIRNRFVKALQEVKSGPHVVVAHSMGSIIAYDCLKRVSNCPKIDTFITVGSPLGLDEVQDKLQPGWSRDDGFPNEKISANWINVFDRLDVIAALDPYLANDYRLNTKMAVEDTAQVNDGLWRHDMKKYLRGPQLSEAIISSLNLAS